MLDCAMEFSHANSDNDTLITVDDILHHHPQLLIIDKEVCKDVHYQVESDAYNSAL